MVCLGAAMAAPVLPHTALTEALKFASQLKQGQTVTLTQVKVDQLDHLYLYNIDQGGFVIVSGDDRTRTVLGYSRHGRLDAATLPDNLRYWLDEYEKQIMQLGEVSLEELYHAYQPAAKPTLPDSVGPLLTSEWNQYRYGYNSLVPYDSTFAADSSLFVFDNHPTVGCGALAMGQIMRYWQFPSHGYGSHSYTYDYECWRYGTLSADFANATYDYAHMPGKLSDSSSDEEVTAVATLLSHCGIAANMNYNSDCRGSSGSTIMGNLMGLQRFFHYSNNSRVEMIFYHSNNEWQNLLKEDLANGRPIYYCGQSYENEEEGTLAGGHAFVCDGYDDDLFHFNWGWNGSANGYYAINVLRPLTSYDFSNYQYCILGLEPCRSTMPIMVMGSDLTLERTTIPQGGHISGRYSIANIGDSVLNTFVGVNIYGRDDRQYYGCVDGRRIIVNPGDTVTCDFSYALSLPEGSYEALMQYGQDTFYAGIETDETMYMDDLDYKNSAVFNVTNSSATTLTNLMIFVRFADDPEIGSSFGSIDIMFNGEGNSVARYFKEMSYDKIHFNTVYTNGTEADHIEAYVDPYPRGNFQPYSPSNPIGYTEPMPQISISMREARLIERICRYVDSTGMVDTSLNLDGDGDGDIDNISFVLQGATDGWGDLLWPHMEYYPHDSIGYQLTINGKLVNCFNFEFEGDSLYFSVQTFCHEMGHSIGLPDLYHYNHHTNVITVPYDIMHSSVNQPAVIYKHKILHLTEEPIRIQQDGTFTIYSNGSSPRNNLYYIKSSIDSNQWFTIEYRSTEDYYESSLLQSGLLIGRWMDTVPMDQNYIGNAYYDYYTRPNTYWIFRQGSDNDSVNGRHLFSMFGSNGLRSFGPNSDPHPYLTDGTPERSFEIYDIAENGSTCTFSVRFLSPEGISEMSAEGLLQPRPNPATGFIAIEGLSAGSPVKIYDTKGTLVAKTQYNGTEIDVSSLSAGLYFIATPQGACKMIKK